jgi:hypothetical protein
MLSHPQRVKIRVKRKQYSLFLTGDFIFILTLNNLQEMNDTKILRI